MTMDRGRWRKEQRLCRQDRRTQATWFAELEGALR